MRIIGGRRRGAKLRAPEGSALRPTADRVREALFDILLHRDFGAPPLAGARVLDLFAGTGALGLEALSRGAAHLTAVETERAALAALRANVKALGVGPAATVLPCDATRLPPAAAPCAYAFLDPPYRSGLAAPALISAAKGGWLSSSAVCVVEMDRRMTFEAPAGFFLLDERRYGAARLAFLRWGETG